ncbi:MAG: hypothetical protein GWN73_38280, partial [Actinobacteria bacterium]|nr:hypothetical protein [Actinomycetota bacterium]NIU70905.1 hypothetical protein [Actinomycetota bacterium]NIW32830.1 hypothetical protein [Actinomycetota bacterium]
MVKRAIGWVALLGMLGCVTEDVGSTSWEAAHPGPWDIPSDTRAIADAQYVAYDGAGAWVGESGCGGSLLPGTAELRYYLLANFEQVSGIGGYSCRRNTGNTSQMSVHGTGRALDIFIPLDGSSADNDAGDVVANWLIEHTEEIGVQYVIWDQWQWVAARSSGDKDRMYTGPHPHHDHLHIELTEEAADRRTAWFTGPMAPPASEPTLPASCDAGTAYDPQFCDDDGHWAENAINYLHDNGLTYGCGEVNGKPRFCPEDTATRGQAIVFIARASEMPTSGHPDAFDDDDGHFAENALNGAAAYGVING